MKLQDFNDRTISITQMRQDIDVLKKALKHQGVAWVTRNQDIMFIAIEPEKYKQLVGKESDYQIEKAVDEINEIQAKYGDQSDKDSSEVISKMRQERAQKWKE